MPTKKNPYEKSTEDPYRPSPCPHVGTPPPPTLNNGFNAPAQRVTGADGELPQFPVVQTSPPPAKK